MGNKVDIFDMLDSSSNKKEARSYSFKYTPVNYITYKYLFKTKTNNTKVFKTHSFKYKIKKEVKAIAIMIGFIKYIATSSLIFAVLLLTANYSAYINVARSYIYADELKIESTSLLNSVEASKITWTIKEKIQLKKKINNDNTKSVKSKYSIKKLTLNSNKKKPQLDIEITPYENRLIIPKIAKNIPLLDIKQKSVSSWKELENIFMKELEDWVVRYPGSTKPWNDWNTFVFGHSSNYPWIKWDYNDVFANLSKLSYWDEVIVYYWQEKYTYVIREKKVISPWDVSILKRDKNKDELTLMTCWPIWTTLNRLILIWEVINKK